MHQLLLLMLLLHGAITLCFLLLLGVMLHVLLQVLRVIAWGSSSSCSYCTSLCNLTHSLTIACCCCCCCCCCCTGC
jgi:hypothetical protein